MVVAATMKGIAVFDLYIPKRLTYRKPQCTIVMMLTCLFEIYKKTAHVFIHIFMEFIIIASAFLM